MAVKPIVMPQLGESVAEATLAKWHVKEGDVIERDQTIAEASTDKADTELPAPISGRITRLLVEVGQTVPVNSPIAEVETEADAHAAPREAQAAQALTSPAPAVSAAPPPFAGRVRPPVAEEPLPQPEPRAAPEATPPAATRAEPTRHAEPPPPPSHAAPTRRAEPPPPPSRAEPPRRAEPPPPPRRAEPPPPPSRAEPTRRAEPPPPPPRAEPAQRPEPRTAIARPMEPKRPEPPVAGRRTVQREGARTSPLVRRIAREQRVDLSEVAGTGASGRVTKDDILRFLAERGEESEAEAPRKLPEPARPQRAPDIAARPEPPPAHAAPKLVVEAEPTRPAAAPEGRPAGYPAGAYRLPEYRPLEGDEIVPFTRRRRLIAEHMVYSKQTSPHVPCLTEIDLHRVFRARTKAKEANQNISVLAYVAAATVHAAREYPTVNATVLEDAYVLRRQINLGVAVDTPEGLVVPVIRKADELSLLGLTRAIAELAEKARAGKLGADDLTGGTLTLSNPGARGNVWGAAIINQPQVAILRMGEVIKRTVVIDVDGEDAIVIRPVMNLVLSYDHRIIDGVAANGFLRRIKELLEANPAGL